MMLHVSRVVCASLLTIGAVRVDDEPKPADAAPEEEAAAAPAKSGTEEKPLYDCDAGIVNEWLVL